MPGTDDKNGALMKMEHEKAEMKILVVEDSRTQAEYLKYILENEGYQVILAANGNDAMEQIKNDRPAIILTDIIMPEMDGYELCRAIKQDGDLADIPVILVTQLFDPADLVNGLEAGADNIIIKPFEPKHVISRITSTLQSSVHTDASHAGSTLEVSLDGRKHLIPASQLKSPAILFSTCDHTFSKNAELQAENDQLAAENEELRQRVDILQQANEKLLFSPTQKKPMATNEHNFQD
jgi:two-component system sensor histidine kinase/response regulator